MQNIVEAFESASGNLVKPVYSLAQIVRQIGDFAWNGNDISYAIPGAADATGQASKTENGGFIAMTAHQVAMAREAFELWDDLIAPNLNETTGWDATMTLAYSSTTTDDGTYCDISRPDQSQVWISSDWEIHKDQNIGYSKDGFQTYIHEIGHALGLIHPGPYNANEPDRPGDDYFSSAIYHQDTQQYTAMSYFAAGENRENTDHWITKFSTTSFSTRNEHIYAASPLLHDIATVQWMYGADLETRTGDTTYGFNNTSGRNSFNFAINFNPVVAIWDAGGNDTLDLSGYVERQIVDLRPGAFSSIGHGMSNNLAMSIAVDSRGAIEGLHLDFNPNDVINYVENAKGGSGHDEITGNRAANRLEGNDGYDTLLGLEGDDWLYGGNDGDTLDGGEGADVMEGGAGDDTYFVDNAGDLVSETVYGRFGNADAGGSDRVETTLAQYTLARNVERLSYTGDGEFQGTGNGLDNAISGGARRDVLRGLGGSDVLSGDDGDDRLDGGAGADYMRGGAGDDIYVVDDVGDEVSEIVRLGTGRYGDAGGTDEVQTSLSQYALGGSIENLTYTGAGAFQGFGNALDNVLRGGRGDDVLDGGEGNDILHGGRGSNTLVGGLGDDTYHVGTLPLYGFSTIVEDVGGGTDTVLYHAVAGAFGSGYTLGAELENLAFGGTADAAGWGNELDNVLRGNSGDNALNGLEGNDTLYGAAGFDILDGGAGDDTLRGGADADSFLLADSWGHDSVVDFADGEDFIDMTLVSGLYGIGQLAIADTGAGIEVAFGYDTIFLEGVGADAIDAADFLFAARPAGEFIVGTDEDDVLAGSAGDDTILGLDGSDVIFEVGNGDTIDAGGGFDYVLAAAETANGGFTFTVAGTNVEFVYGGAGNDVVDASGASDFIQFAADAGDDVLIGSLYGGAFDGGEGEDTMVFAGAYADYAIAAPDEYGSIAVVEIASGATDWLTGVEIARFNDGSWLLAA